MKSPKQAFEEMTPAQQKQAMKAFEKFKKQKAAEKKLKERRKKDEYLMKKREAGETFDIWWAFNYDYPTGKADDGPFNWDDDEDHNYLLAKAAEAAGDDAWKEFYDKEIGPKLEPVIKKLIKLSKSAKYKEIPYPAQGSEESEKKLDEWENDLFQAVYSLPYSYGGEHHGYGMYNGWFSFPFKRPKWYPKPEDKKDEN